MKIGILLTGHAPETLLQEAGDYDLLFRQLLTGHDFEFETYPVVDGIFPDSPLTCDGWLITGSKHGVYEDLPWIAPLETLIRDIRDAARPLVGICFGHQIIAQALGGRVEKFAGGWVVGSQAYVGANGPGRLNAWHQDQVVELPAGAQVLASSDSCQFAAVAYGPTIYTVQAHPEFNADVLANLIRMRGRGVVPDPLLDQAEALLDSPTTARDEAARLARVLKGVPA
ncbi:type 1 glutamine amidotransferase [Pseudooceanicola aestuarii]|uniref:type 1 glutamine amidotransferase n=1 Tax=Pseudooceanicola aestuarii TaxID=2697319 RepID=UPI0013D5171C|nr:type 1 glutamine amidotransferase [Pseudooceanicola aestuarii]